MVRRAWRFEQNAFAILPKLFFAFISFSLSHDLVLKKTFATYKCCWRDNWLQALNLSIVESGAGHKCSLLHIHRFSQPFFMAWLRAEHCIHIISSNTNLKATLKCHAMFPNCMNKNGSSLRETQPATVAMKRLIGLHVKRTYGTTQGGFKHGLGR